MKGNSASKGESSTCNGWLAPEHNLNTSKALRKIRKAVKKAMRDGWVYKMSTYTSYEDVYAAIEEYYRDKMVNQLLKTENNC